MQWLMQVGLLLYQIMNLTMVVTHESEASDHVLSKEHREISVS